MKTLRATKRRSDQANKGLAPSRSAFTLVELMVAIALVLVLMLGVSRIFTATTGTVGANQAISDNTRDARAAQSVMAADFERVASDAPFFMIRSRVQAAFRSRADELSDRDANKLTTNIDGDATEGNSTGETVAPATYNARNHRLDAIGFFTRGLQQRQTGNPDTLVANQTCPEQYVNYGHLKLDSKGLFSPSANYDPGAATAANNPDNFYSTQWILGRVAIQLRDPESDQRIYDNGTPRVPQDYFPHRSGNTGTPFTGTTVTPYQGNSPGTGIPNVYFQDCRYDLAGVSISTYGTIWTNFLGSNASGWSDVAGIARRFQCNPFVLKPVDSKSFSQQFPVFLPRSTQFVIEFAGDFLVQDGTTGAVTSVGQDNQIDFLVKGVVPNTTRSIRWYGLPRNVDPSDDSAAGPMIQGGVGTMAPLEPNNMLDVVPVRDVITRAGLASLIPTTPASWFERFDQYPMTMCANYAASAGGMLSSDNYVCYWSPTLPRPKMIRITLALDDPNGRLAEEQWFEYVFTIP